MATAAGIRAGQCFVEIHANDTHFQRGMVILSNRMQALGQRLRAFGAGLGLGVAAIGAPMIGALRATSEFENALLELQAATNGITPGQMRAVREEALRLSEATGLGPEKFAQSFAQLVKAGMTVEDALGGAAESAAKFAHISGVDAEAAALFMKSAMYSFGTSAKEAADTLSSAADSSSTSIAEMIQAFGLIGSTGTNFNQSLFGISQAMAVLSNYMIRGEEAGTGLKVFLQRLISPSSEANKALAKFGLTVRSFRNEAGKLLPMAQIADIIRQKMGAIGDELLKDQVLVDVFGDRGIKVISAFAKTGKEGFDTVAQSMAESRSVAEKFDIMMGGVSGSFTRLNTAVKQLAIGFGTAVTEPLVGLTEWLVRAGAAARRFLESHPGLSRWAAGLTLGAGAVSVLAVGLGFIATSIARVLGWGVQLSRLFIALGGIVIPRIIQAIGLLRVAVLALSASTPLGAILALAGVVVGGSVLSRFFSSRRRSAAANAAEAAAEPEKALVNPEQFQKPMDGRVGGAIGANHGTFFGGVAEQIGIGPTLDAANRTANATERAADGIEDMLGQMRANPNDLQAGMQDAAAAGGAVAPNGRDVIDAAEKTAMESKRTNDLLAQLVRLAGEGRLQFA